MTTPRPPFKLASGIGSGVPMSPFGSGFSLAPCCSDDVQKETRPDTRSRLADLDSHYHCSVIGTCLTTGELRKIIGRHAEVRHLSDLEIHHDAVSLSCQPGPVLKALQKALDQRHEQTIRRIAKVQEEAALGTFWDDAMRSGDVPGAYWALLTHPGTTPELRSRIFGDVHMLSHLVGSSNRADIRRLTALEQENAELRERLEAQQQQAQESAQRRDLAIRQLQQELAESRLQCTAAQARASSRLPTAELQHALANSTALVALHTERREQAERTTTLAQGELARVQEELDHLRKHVTVLRREMSVAETQLRELADAGDACTVSALDQPLRGRRILYVGGRPSSTPTIRALVLRHGGHFQRHDGGLEDRKGLLAAAVLAAELVVFPVDCIDHDSAGMLKRLCIRHGIPFVPMRTASVTGFVAALAGRTLGESDDSTHDHHEDQGASDA